MQLPKAVHLIWTWDEGTYEPLHRQDGKEDDEILHQELDEGSLKIILHGQKLKGEFALVKMHTAKEKNAWLLIKHDDAHTVRSDYDAEDHLPIHHGSHTSHSGWEKTKRRAETEPEPEQFSTTRKEP